MAEDTIVVSGKYHPDRLQGLIAAAVADENRREAWWAALRDGALIEVHLVEPAPVPDDMRSGHVPELDARRPGLDAANFCLMAAAAGHDWYQAIRAFWWLVRSELLVVQADEPCGVVRCAMKLRGQSAIVPHKLLPVQGFLALTPTRLRDAEATALRLQIIASVQVLVLERNPAEG